MSRQGQTAAPGGWRAPVRIRMLARMRTTLVLDDALLRRAKIAAARSGSTLSKLVERALRDALREDTRPVEEPFVFPTYGASPTSRRARADHLPVDFHAALEEDDRATVRRDRR